MEEVSSQELATSFMPLLTQFSKALEGYSQNAQVQCDKLMLEIYMRRPNDLKTENLGSMQAFIDYYAHQGKI